jgi:Spy/CpxP family protein refolding chaperone
VRLWKPILAAVVIFTAGAVFGALLFNPTQTATDVNGRTDRRDGRGDRREGPPPGQQRPWSFMGSEAHIREICERMTRDLDLSPAQQETIQDLIRQSQARIKAISDELAPKTREEMNRAREEIRALLTPEQQAKFDEINRRREARWRKPVGLGADPQGHPSGYPDAPPAGAPPRDGALP